ncbi:MAG: hypothetical protein J6B85_11220, partial [Lachnospiraceae bacterium]|nr:hypothetical protein [Lachnospiraceae bacterium]
FPMTSFIIWPNFYYKGSNIIRQTLKSRLLSSVWNLSLHVEFTFSFNPIHMQRPIPHPRSRYGCENGLLLCGILKYILSGILPDAWKTPLPDLQKTKKAPLPATLLILSSANKKSR